MSTPFDKYHQSYIKTKKQSKLIAESNFTYVNFFRYMLPSIKQMKPKRILDIGSGAGTISLFLGSLGHQVVGIDISREAVAVSSQSALDLRLEKNVRFITGDFINYSIKEKFEVIICLEVIEHCKDDDQLLKKISSLLKRDGLLVLSTPLVTAPLARIGLTKGFDTSVGHLRRYTRSSIVQKMKKANFLIEDILETEGLLRNSLYVFPKLNFFTRFIRGFFTYIVTIIDDFVGKFFGYSDLIILARKK